MIAIESLSKTRFILWPVLCALVILFGVPAFGKPNEILAGKVVSVTDGDTISVLSHQAPVKVRLASVDCPEKAQPFGTLAKKFTADSCFGKQVEVSVLGRDRYGRLIGSVYLESGKCLNTELVKVGLAWWYEKYDPGNIMLSKLQQQAKDRRLGLWIQPQPIRPWEFRRQKKNQLEVR